MKKTGFDKILVVIFFVFAGQVSVIRASGIVAVGDYSVAPLSEFTVSISLSTTEGVVAFQADMPLPEGFLLVDGSAVFSPERTDGHSLSVSLLSGNVVRILVYSAGNKVFKGTGGELVSIRLKSGSIPATYGLQLTNVLVSNAQSQSVTGDVTAGSVTVQSPDLHLSAVSFDFGRVALQSKGSRTVELHNTGNEPLLISSIVSTDSQFTSAYASGVQVEAGQSAWMSIEFTPASKGTKTAQLIIRSNDPDRPTETIQLTALAYAVNQLHIGSISGSSSTSQTLEVSINNMEPFTGFQFDLQLPDVLVFKDGGARVFRADGHSVLVNKINGNMLRVIGYSASNKAFVGVEGKVLELDFLLDGNSGYYNMPVSNVIIADNAGANILSNAYGNSAIVTSSDINTFSQLGFGDVSVLTPKTTNHSISNYGQEILVIHSLTFSSGQFSSSATFPISISPWSSHSIPVSCSLSTKGSTTATMRIFSNDPDESPFEVQLTANGIVPNRIKVVPAIYQKGKSAYIDVEVENYDSCVAVQCELRLPEGMTVSGTLSPELTNRRRDHVISMNALSPGLARVLVFSPGQKNIAGSSGVLFRIPCEVSSTAGVGGYTVKVENALLSDNQMQNVLYATADANVTVVNATKRLGITLMLEGLYSGNGIMRESQFNGGPVWGTGNADIVKVELRSASEPNTLLYGKDSVLLSINGHAELEIPAEIASSSFYLIVKHRFSMPVCSSGVLQIEGDELQYSFAEQASRAYGSNQVLLATGIYGLYSGELNADGFINILDRGLLLKDLNSASQGYLPSNLNGDVYINIIDRGILLINLNKGITIQLPAGMIL